MSEQKEGMQSCPLLAVMRGITEAAGIQGH